MLASKGNLGTGSMSYGIRVSTIVVRENQILSKVYWSSACTPCVIVHANMRCQSWSDRCNVFKGIRLMEIVPGRWPRFGLGSGIPLLKLSVEDLGEPVGLTMWEMFGDECFATGRPGDCMEMLLECLRNPGYRFGIVTVCSRFVAYGAPPLKIYVTIERAKLTCYRALKVVAMGIHGVEGQWWVMEQIPEMSMVTKGMLRKGDLMFLHTMAPNDGNHGRHNEGSIE
eukprot:Gb_16162 [translate_table: standard]